MKSLNLFQCDNSVNIKSKAYFFYNICVESIVQRLFHLLKLANLYFVKKDDMPCDLTANIRYFYKTFH